MIGTLTREEAAYELREIQQQMLNLIDDARSVLSAGDIGGKRGWMDQISAALFGDYGSGSNIGGLGLVFILGVVVIGLGIVIMIWQAVTRPAFFKGETLSLDAPESLRRARR